MTQAGVPTWSGEFWETQEGRGIMSVHFDDKRSPQPPDGWRLTYTLQDDDSTVYVYAKTRKTT